ncbi:MAG: PAS domain S-box protein [Labilibaculum antarcticum]
MNKKSSKTKEELLIKISQLEAKIYSLEKSESQSNIWLENLPVCTKIVDPDFNLQYMSSSGIRELKIDDITEFYGKPYPLSFYPDSFKIPMIKNLKRAKETGETIRQEAPTQDIEGNTLWYHSTIVPVYNDKEQLDYIMVISLETTSSKKAENNLIESKQFLDSVYHGTNLAIAVVDVNKAGEYHFMGVNKQHEKIIGINNEEYVGKTPKQLENIFGKEMIDFILVKYNQIVKKKKALIYELAFAGTSGKEKIFSHTLTPLIDDDGRVYRIITFSEDITEIKEAQEALKRSEATISNKLKAITEPGGDISTLELSDIIDTEMLQSLMEDFYQITGMLGAVLDVSGKVLVAVGWQDICTKFHRCNAETRKNCIESDTVLTQGVPEGTYKAYHCKNNMWDIVTPLMVGERHVGNVFMGQYFLEGEVPNVEFFRKQAKKYGFDEKEYLAALDRVPRFSQKTVDAGMKFYSNLAGLITSLSYSSIQQSRMLAERKLAEKELIKAKIKAEENQKLYEDLVQSSHNLIWKCDLEGKFTFLNSAWENTHGYKVEEMLGRPFSDFQRPEIFERDVIEFTKHLEGGFVKGYETTHIIKDGTEITLIFNALPIFNSLGEIIGTQGTAFDISKLKQTELEIIKEKEKAEESEKKYRDLINLAQEGIWVIDKNNTTNFTNPSMAKMLGYASEEMIGKSLFDFMDETGIKLASENIERRKVGLKEQHDFEFICKNGNRIFCTMETAPIIDKEGKYLGAIAGVIDITERKKAEDNVRKLSTAVEQSPSSIVIADKEGNLEYVNPKFTELTGYSSSEAVGAKANILKSGEQSTLFYKKLWETVDSGKVWRGQFHNKKKNGELFWEAASISAILNESGDIINYIKIGEDITLQKNTEAELNIALEKALESDRLKSAFLANMSHEIRTPMNGILGFVNLLNEPNLSKSKIDKYSTIINKSGERLLNTINDIIDISKIEADEIIISNTETSINNVMEELHSFFSPEANQKGLSLDIEPSVSTEQLIVITDSHKLHGILSNLIKNAIKYTEKGHITFGYTVKEDFISFFVTDTGIGIPKDRLQAIFNRFEQADIEDRSAFEGSGLGLAISKAYTEMLGGEIFAESIEGKGSTFTFTIPYVGTIKEGTQQVPVNIDNDAVRIKNLNLLIVEDDDVSSELLKSTMQGLFKEIIFADNGKDAIKICRNNPELHLVLMDIKMPKMNGYDATKEIRTFNKDLVIIAQTAYAFHGDKEKAIEVGCNDYITKPINKASLLEIINKLLG